jgi:hypothetical protein
VTVASAAYKFIPRVSPAINAVGAGPSFSGLASERSDPLANEAYINKRRITVGVTMKIA